MIKYIFLTGWLCGHHHKYLKYVSSDKGHNDLNCLKTQTGAYA